MNRSDQELLSDYARGGGDAAFTELVRRHVDLVYSAACRMLRDSHLAQDVTQSVFLALARQASELSRCPVLAGWLHRTTQNLAANTIRSEVRRRQREQTAHAMNDLLRGENEPDWAQLAPQLDAALGELDEGDRDALLLRYFQGKSAQEMSGVLGVSAEAAQKRVSRAVERLRGRLAARGVAVAAGSVVASLSAHAVQAAPAGLAASISASVLAVAPAAVGLGAKTAFITMKWTASKIAIAATATALLTGAAVHFLEQSEAERLRARNAELEAEGAKLSQEREEAIAAARDPQAKPAQSVDPELLRLRGEVGRLREQAKKMEALESVVQRQQGELAKVQQREGQRTEEEAIIKKMNLGKQLALAVIMYAADNGNQLPGHLNQTTNYAPGLDPALRDQFELVLNGPLSGVTNPPYTIALRERQPSVSNGQRRKTYAFADGHVQNLIEPPEGFDAWEAPRMPGSAASGGQ